MSSNSYNIYKITFTLLPFAMIFLISCARSDQTDNQVAHQSLIEKNRVLGHPKIINSSKNPTSLNDQHVTKWDKLYSQNRSSEQKAYCLAKTKSKFSNFTDWIFTVETPWKQGKHPKIITLLTKCETFQVPVNNFNKPTYFKENNVVLASGKFSGGTLDDVDITLVLDN